MTVKVPPEGPFVLTGPATDVEANKLRHSAATFRRMLDGLFSARQGVVYSRGTCQDLKVNATGTPDGFLHVVTGACYVRGTQATDQGMYHIFNDAQLDINVLGPNPAHATLDRIDLVVARIQDTFYAGAVDTATIEMVTGTPAGSPGVPAAPANSLILAQVSVPHATSTIPQSQITDRRVPAGNGVIVLDDILVGTDSRYPAATAQIDFLNTTGVGTNLIPPGFGELTIQYLAREDGAVASDFLNLRVNNDSTADYDSERQGFSGTVAAAPVETLGATFGTVGALVGASGTGGFFASGEVVIPAYSSLVGDKLFMARSVWSDSNVTGHQNITLNMAKWRVGNTPITRVSLIPGAGNFIVGSRFVLKATAGIQP